MNRRIIVTMAGKAALFVGLVVIPFVLVLVIVGTGIAAAAIHLGEQISGRSGPLPTWLDPPRIIAAVGSAIAALSGAIVAIGAIEWQDWRRRARARHIVEEALTNALVAGYDFFPAYKAGASERSSEYLLQIVMWVRTARDVAASQRDKVLLMARVAAELDTQSGELDSLQSRATGTRATLVATELAVRDLMDRIDLILDEVFPDRAFPARQRNGTPTGKA